MTANFVVYLYYHKYLIESYSVLELKEEEKSKITWCKEYHNAACSIYELENLKVQNKIQDLKIYVNIKSLCMEFSEVESG